MEAVPYGILFLFLIMCFLTGLVVFVKSVREKSKNFFIISLVLIGFPFLVFFSGDIFNLINTKPRESDLVGVYKISSSDYDYENAEKHILELKGDGTFTFTENPAISLCRVGKYELDYKSEYNELTFQCGLGWSPAHIKRNIRGFEIEFFYSDGSVIFSKH